MKKRWDISWRYKIVLNHFSAVQEISLVYPLIHFSAGNQLTIKKKYLIILVPKGSEEMKEKENFNLNRCSKFSKGPDQNGFAIIIQFTKDRAGKKLLESSNSWPVACYVILEQVRCDISVPVLIKIFNFAWNVCQVPF